MFIIQTILEFSVAGFIIWGLFNEDKLVDFEDKVIDKIKAKIAAKKRSNFYRHTSLNTENEIADAG